MADVEQIKQAQALLQYLGLYKGSIDGIWGDMSKSAMMELCKRVKADVNSPVCSGDFDESKLKLIQSYMTAQMTKRFDIKSFVIGALLSAIVGYIVKLLMKYMLERTGVGALISEKKAVLTEEGKKKLQYVRGYIEPGLYIESKNGAIRPLIIDKIEKKPRGESVIYFRFEDDPKKKYYAKFYAVKLVFYDEDGHEFTNWVKRTSKKKRPAYKLELNTSGYRPYIVALYPIYGKEVMERVVVDHNGNEVWIDDNFREEWAEEYGKMEAEKEGGII